MRKGSRVSKTLSVLLSLLLVLSVLTPTVQAVDTGVENTQGMVEEQTDVEELLARTVQFYKNKKMKLDSWQLLVGLYAAGEDLNDGEWVLPEWQKEDPDYLEPIHYGTDHIRFIFGLLAMNEDPADAWETNRNLYAELASQQNEETGSFGGINKHMWAVLAMDTGERLGADLGEWNTDKKQKALQFLIDNQNEDGGYSFFGPVSDPDMTGMGMIALSNYQGEEAADAAIERTKDLLRARQLDLTTGGFNSPGNFGMGDNANSTATAIWGLAAVNENVLAEKWHVGNQTVVDAIKGFQFEDGSYKWKVTDKSTNLMATEQVLLALADMKAGSSVWNRIALKTERPTAYVKVDGVDAPILADTAVAFEAGDTIVQVVEQLLKEQNIPYELDQAKENFVSINNVQNGNLHGNDQWVVDVNEGSSTSLFDNVVNDNDKIHIFYKRNAVLESITKLKVGDKDPTIELTLSGDTFTEAASNVSNWTIGNGALTVGSVTVESSQNVLLHVQGEVPNVTLSITGLAKAVQSNVNTTANNTPAIPETIRTVDDMLADTLRFYEVERYNKDNFRWSMPGISWTELVALGASSSQLSDGTAQLPEWLTKDPGLQKDEADTDHIRYIFGLLAVGKDPSTAWESKRNLYAELAAQQKADGSIGGINKHAWAMLALDTGEKRGQDVGTWGANAKEKALQHLLKQEKEKGGFSLSLNEQDTADPDMTGMVLLALANYQDDSAANAAIERAKQALREQQLDTAGWGAWGENSNSIATVISGLVAVGEDVTSDKWQKGEELPLDALSKFQTKNGAFAFTLPADQWVNTKAVEQSLIALQEIKTGKSVWQQFSEVENVEPPADETSITFSVETRTMDTGDIISPKSLKIESGDTAFTVLRREVENRSIPFKFTGAGPTIYVKSINNIGEFDGGPLSGWMYSVNGEFPQYSAGIYELQKDDILRWQYTRDLGADLGDNWNPTPEISVDAPENVQATITDGKLQLQIKDEKTGELQAAKVEKTEVVGGFMIVQIGETGNVLDSLEGLELTSGIQQVVVLDNDKPYNYFKSESEIKSTKEWNIKFSGALQNDAKNLEKVVIRNAAGEIVQVSTTLGEDGKSLKIKPSTRYTQGELYYLTITDVLSANGEVIKEPIRKIYVIE
ncbi:hypothetical protein CSV80_05570 [Sporosarcina sp. P12(2017)]|uniref:DUF4430 domain-containing protein n=1 Tax=unclassified Sporosarcina TaxID=2647733 RepID=UPI000C169C46|nr:MULTISPECIES: DUF4430 domain-containing protein [unclassified Sporosarcina]PIC58344.1 hypothetical protein CSV81_04160 [Sporosarcina sp. P10]PIC61491.1 hypothetical protein CSV80_05570 [Sporosarcina sp. P12(2017)]